MSEAGPSGELAEDDSGRRKLGYRTLLESAGDLHRGVIDEDACDRTRSIIERADALLKCGRLEERVRHPGETLLDSRVVIACSSVVGKCVEAVVGGGSYDPGRLAERAKADPFRWEMRRPLRAPDRLYLGGAFLPGPHLEKSPRRRAHAQRQKAAEKAEPDRLSVIHKAEETSSMVVNTNKFINKYYKNNGSNPIPLFPLVLHPNNFGRTVENIYHISFLVRDGFVAINMDENGLPVLVPVSKADKENQRKNVASKNNQFIFSMDMAEWQEAVKAFNIQKPLMTFRN